MGLELAEDMVLHLRSAMVLRVGTRSVLLSLTQAQLLYKQLGQALAEAETAKVAGVAEIYASAEVDECPGPDNRQT